MGFRPQPKQYKLTFADDTDLAGFEVTVGSVSVDEYNRMLREGLHERLTEETLKANDWLLELFASRLVSWNLEDAKGKPVKPVLAAVLGLDRSYVAKLVTAWQVALVQVPKAPGGESPNGETGLTAEDLKALAAASASPSS